MRRSFILILAFILMFSCKKKQEDFKISGSFTLDGSSYSLTALSVDHVGYAEIQQMPVDTSVMERYDSTMFVLHACFSGYKSAIHLYLCAPDNDFRTGVTYDCLCDDSLSCVILFSDNGDTILQNSVISASLIVDSIDDPVASGENWLNYHFTLDVDNTSSSQVNGQFAGPHTINYIVDQPSFGFLSFDTVTVGLARPSLYRWGHLFCDDSNYFELKFYSNAARFSENGTISQGVQFAVGFHSFQQNYPAVGDYPISMEAKEATALYGHRMGSVNWGTYWQIFYSGSVAGKANILSDTIRVVRWDSDSLTISFNLTDQLGNRVKGSYEGPYY